MQQTMNTNHISPLLSETSSCESATGIRRTKGIQRYLAERYACCSPQLAAEAEGEV